MRFGLDIEYRAAIWAGYVLSPRVFDIQGGTTSTAIELLNRSKLSLGLNIAFHPIAFVIVGLCIQGNIHEFEGVSHEQELFVQEDLQTDYSSFPYPIHEVSRFPRDDPER